MPRIGEIVTGDTVGYKFCRKVMWVACPDCGIERWIEVVGGIPRNLRCRKCADKLKGIRMKKEGKLGDKSHTWRGGKHLDSHGYVWIYLLPGDFFESMIPSVRYARCVAEHRLVMAKSLGRCLHTWEAVHHINGIKHDNRIENLQLLGTEKHNTTTRYEFKINNLNKRIVELANEVARLMGENTKLRMRLLKCNGISVG